MSYKEMINLVRNHEICDFFPSYSGLTRTTYEAEISEPFIEEIFKEYEPDLITASTHKFSASAGSPSDKVTYFRDRALKWALEEFRMYSGQWNKYTFGHVSELWTDLDDVNYHIKIAFILDILRNEIKTSRNKVIKFFSSKYYGYDEKTCVSIYYHILSSIDTNTISWVNAKWVG